MFYFQPNWIHYYYEFKNAAVIHYTSEQLYAWNLQQESLLMMGDLYTLSYNMLQ